MLRQMLMSIIQQKVVKSFNHCLIIVILQNIMILSPTITTCNESLNNWKTFFKDNNVSFICVFKVIHCNSRLVLVPCSVRPKTAGPSVSFTIENGPPWTRTCYRLFGWYVRPVRSIESMTSISFNGNIPTNQQCSPMDDGTGTTQKIGGGIKLKIKWLHII